MHALHPAQKKSLLHLLLLAFFPCIVIGWASPSPCIYASSTVTIDYRLYIKQTSKIVDENLSLWGNTGQKISTRL